MNTAKEEQFNTLTDTEISINQNKRKFNYLQSEQPIRTICLLYWKRKTDVYSELIKRCTQKGLVGLVKTLNPKLIERLFIIIDFYTCSKNKNN